MKGDNNLSKKHVQVPNNMTKSPKLIPRDLAVYAIIKKYVNYKTGETFVGLETIAKDCNLTIPTVRKSINTLKECGYITITKKGRSNVYTFNKYKNFEPFSYEFLDIDDLDITQKGYVIAVQQHLFKDVEGYGKTTYSNEQLSEILNISSKTIQRLDKSLMEKGYMNIIKTSAIDNTTGLKINEKIFYLNELDQAIIWTLQKHDDKINEHEDRINTIERQLSIVLKENEDLKKELNKQNYKEDTLII